MFLSNLNMIEKKAFLELAHLVANANGIIEENERKMIDQFAEEMGIGIHLDDLDHIDLETIIPAFESELTRKAVFVEAIAVAFADGLFQEEENELIHRIRESFGFSVQYYESVKEWVLNYNNIYKKGIELVHGTPVSM